jgi:hypothetical protein
MMRKIVIPIVVFLFIPSCRESTNQIIDQTSIVRGVVLDSQSSQPIDSVMVGWKMHNYPDSILFVNGEIVKDSVIINYTVHEIQNTAFNGSFIFQIFLAPTPPYPYEDMFACKKGYNVWRFDSSQDKVVSVGQFIDTLIIRLNKL